MTSAISGMNFSNLTGLKVNSYKPKNDIKVEYTSQVFEEIDYSDVAVYNDVFQVENKDPWKAAAERWERSDNLTSAAKEKMASSILPDSVFYGAGAAGEFIDAVVKETKFGKSPFGTIISILGLSLIAGGTKGAIAKVQDKGFWAESAAAFTKKSLTQIKPVKKGSEWLAAKMMSGFAKVPDFDKKAFEKMFDKVKMSEVRVTFLDDVMRESFLNFSKNLSFSIGPTAVIDWAAGTISNIIKYYIENKSFDGFTWSDTRIGEIALQSTWKTVGAVAGQIIGFACLGPKGKIVGKAIGSVVGNAIGKGFVTLFEGNEAYCGAAAVATATCATAAGVIATMALAGATSLSVPVVGWIVGGCILLGAAVGSIATWIVYLAAT